MMRSQSPFSSRPHFTRDRIPAEAQPPPARRQQHGLPRRAPLVLAGTLGLLGALAVSYTVGRIEAAAKTTQVRAEAEKTTHEHERAVAALEDKLAARSAEVALLEARRRIHLSVIALGDRNFGIARDELAKAGSLLRNLPARKKTKDDTLVALSKELESYETVVTHDLGEQRTDVVTFARRLDEAIDRL